MNTQEVFTTDTFNPFDLMRDCGEKLAHESEIKFIRLSTEDFYKNLNQFPDTHKNPDLESLEGSYCACVGGVFRSPRMARYLEQKGVRLADTSCRNGYSLSDLPGLIDKSDIRNDGSILPKDFSSPITNLFVGINVESEGCEGCILLTLNSLIKKQKGSLTPIKLNIYLVDGDESESASLYRELRAFDPDLDGSEPTVSRGI